MTVCMYRDIHTTTLYYRLITSETGCTTFIYPIEEKKKALSLWMIKLVTLT